MLKRLVTTGGIALAIALGASVATAQNQQGAEKQPGTEKQQGAEKQQGGQQLSVKKLTANPAPYVGKKLTVAGAVDDAMGPNVFTFKDDREVVPDDVLVISKKPISGAQSTPKQLEKKPLTVTGTLRYFNLDEVSRETGIALDAASFERWNGKLVLITEGIDKGALAQNDQSQQGSGQQSSETTGSSGSKEETTGSSQSGSTQGQTAQTTPPPSGTMPQTPSATDQQTETTETHEAHAQAKSSEQSSGVSSSSNANQDQAQASANTKPSSEETASNEQHEKSEKSEKSGTEQTSKSQASNDKSSQTTGSASSDQSASGQKQTAGLDDVGAILDAPNKSKIVGQRVNLTGVQVRNVVKNRGFWVGQSDDQQVFVRFDPKKLAQQNRPDVNPGDTVDLTGVLKKAPAPKELGSWGLGKQNAALLQKERVYINADTLSITPPAGQS